MTNTDVHMSIGSPVRHLCGVQSGHNDRIRATYNIGQVTCFECRQAYNRDMFEACNKREKHDY